MDGNPPGARVVGQGELGELVVDLEVAEPGLLGDLVPEPDAVVEGAHPKGEPPLWRRRLFYGDGQLVVVIAHPRHLAPGLGPPLVVRIASRVGDAKAVEEPRRPAELEAEHGGEDQRAPVAGEAVGEVAVLNLHRHLVAPVGRGDANLARERSGSERQPGYRKGGRTKAV